MSFEDKISVEEIIDEDFWEGFFVKYIAALCKNCGAEPGDEHTCDKKKKDN